MFSYYGSKSRVVHRYPPPMYRTIIEPFAGSARYAVYWAERGMVDRVILVEKDKKVARAWRWLIQASEDEVRDLPVYEFGQEIEYPDVGGRYFLRMMHSGGASKGPRVSTRVISTFKGSQPKIIRNRINMIASKLQHIRNFETIEGGYYLAPDIKATWFVDPPYQEQGRHYPFGSDLLEYDTLAEWCRSRKGRVIVCEGINADWLPFRPLITQHGQFRQSTERICILRGRG